jgi:hypothetical protein
MKYLVRRLVGLVMLVGVGCLAGGAVTPLAAIEPAYAGCENDECDRWFFWERCRDNPSGITKCVSQGRGCVTLSCHQNMIPE